MSVGGPRMWALFTEKKEKAKCTQTQELQSAVRENKKRQEDYYEVNKKCYHIKKMQIE